MRRTGRIVAFKMAIDETPSIIFREEDGAEFEAEIGPFGDLFEFEVLPVHESDGMTLTMDPPLSRCRNCGETWHASRPPGICDALS